VAIAPLFLVWFGVGALPKVLVAFLISFFPS
jgi:NitT/TauT family transport system permease protein